MRSSGSPYEVRCPRCDVSFPPETRTCVHCGGRITRGADEPAIERAWREPRAAEPRTAAPASSEPEPIFSMQPAHGEIEGEAEPASLSRTLLRSLGTILWVGLLIAFTLARNCGGE